MGIYEKKESPLVYMFIDTEGKSKEELIIEVTIRVNELFDREISRIEAVASNLAGVIINDLNNRRDNMIKSFVLQIENMGIINDQMREKETV